MTLQEKLEQIQTALGLSDRKFAARLGISGVAWFNIKKKWKDDGESRLGLKTLSAVLRAYPDLKSDVIAYMLEVQPEQQTERVVA